MLAFVLAAALSTPVHETVQETIQETIHVERVLVDVRVVDDFGAPVLDLTPEDFEVRIARKRAVVESVEFVRDDVGSSWSAPSGAQAPTTDNRQPTTTAQPRGRTIILFVQTDVARESSRVHGHMNFVRYAEDMIAELAPDDRVAVFSFDSHLKFRLDLTTDKQRVIEALSASIFLDHPPPPPVVPAPSLARHLDRDAMRRAAHAEKALLLVAHALRQVPGPKSLLLIGWGLGELTTGGVRMKRDWEAARYAMDRARVSIFALDTTYADYHDLEIGLQTAAEETGGFYAKTHLFPGLAIERLQRTLSGHYELTLRASESMQAGTHALTVRVKRRGARMLAPASIVIR
jgi:VWFA-related protein